MVNAKPSLESDDEEEDAKDDASSLGSVTPQSDNESDTDIGKVILSEYCKST